MGRWRRGEERRAEGDGKKKERAVSIVGGGERVNADEYGTVRPGWGRGIVQELCSVLFYSTLLYDIMTTVYG